MMAWCPAGDTAPWEPCQGWKLGHGVLLGAQRHRPHPWGHESCFSREARLEDRWQGSQAQAVGGRLWLGPGAAAEAAGEEVQGRRGMAEGPGQAGCCVAEAVGLSDALSCQPEPGPWPCALPKSCKGQAQRKLAG